MHVLNIILFYIMSIILFYIILVNIVDVYYKVKKYIFKGAKSEVARIRTWVACLLYLWTNHYDM